MTKNWPMRSLTGIILCAALIFAQSFCGAWAQMERISNAGAGSSPSLSPGARETAALLGILPAIERLIELKQEKNKHGADSIDDEEMALKITVIDKVLGASLEVQMVSGAIDKEIAWAYAGHDMLQAKRQRNLNYLYTASFMQGGILGILSGPAFLSGYPIMGTDLLLVASSVGLGLSTASLVGQRSGSKRVDGGATMLSDVFHLERPTPPAHRADMVIKYLNSVPPQSSLGKTRIEALMDGWKKGHYLRSSNESYLQKLAAVEPSGKKYRENIGLLENRIRMLFDTQYTIELLHGDLLELLRLSDL